MFVCCGTNVIVGMVYGIFFVCIELVMEVYGGLDWF